MPIQNVRIDLLGTSFTIQTDESIEYINSIISELKRRINYVNKSSKINDPVKIAILVSIYLTDELIKERGKSSESAEIERITHSIISKMEEELK